MYLHLNERRNKRDKTDKELKGREDRERAERMSRKGLSSEHSVVFSNKASTE